MFEFGVNSKPVFSLGVTFSGSATCQLSSGFGLNIPVPEVPGLIVSVAPYFSLNATGSIKATVSWTPQLGINIARGFPGAQNFWWFKSKVSASANGSASVTLRGGIQVSVSVGHALGLEVEIGPELTTDASVNDSNACIEVTADLQLEGKLFAHVFFVDNTWTIFDGHFDESALLDRCTSNASTASGSGSAAPPQNVSSSTGTATAPPYAGSTISETTGATASTWTDYANASGGEGPSIEAHETVGVVCRLVGFAVADGNRWWYLVGSSPWNAAFYVSADPFYNDGATTGSLHGTPLYDSRVPLCANSAGVTALSGVTTPSKSPTGTASSSTTYSETTGGLARTWADFADGGGTEGQSIEGNQTVRVTCRVEGLAVSDGNPWWYQIDSSPWNDDYYASADAFYNNGQVSGSLTGTPFYDKSVPICASSGTIIGGTGGVGTPESIDIGWSTSHPSWIYMTLNGFSPGTYTYSCDFGSGGDKSFALPETTSPETFDNGETCYDAVSGDTVWVTVDGVKSNTITVGTSGSPPPPAKSISIGWGPNPAPAGNWMDITFSNFPTGPVSWYCVEEGVDYGPYSTTLTSGTETFTSNTCYDATPGGTDYVTADGVNSNSIGTD